MAARKSTDERIAEMVFGTVYPLYVDKVEKKGRTEGRASHEVIRWLTGFDDGPAASSIIDEKARRSSTFFERRHAPSECAL